MIMSSSQFLIDFFVACLSAAAAADCCWSRSNRSRIYFSSPVFVKNFVPGEVGRVERMLFHLFHEIILSSGHCYCTHSTAAVKEYKYSLAAVFGIPKTKLLFSVNLYCSNNDIDCVHNTVIIQTEPE